MLKKLPLGLHKMHHVRVEPDYNSDGSVESNGSQEGREDIRMVYMWDTEFLIGAETEEEQLSEQEEC